MSATTLGRNLLLMHEARALAASAQKAGLPLLFLKGAALLAWGLRDWSERPMTDVDVLIRPEDRPKLEKLLAAMAYAPMDGSRQAWGRFDKKVPLLIDVHDALRYRRSLGPVFAGRREASLEGQTFLVPGLEECVLETVGHAFLHHGGVSRRDREDLLALFQTEIDFGNLAREARALGLGELLFAASEGLGGGVHRIAAFQKLRGRGPRRWAARWGATGGGSRGEVLFPILFAPHFAASRIWPSAEQLQRTYPGLSPWRARLKRTAGLIRKFGGRP